MQSCDTQLIWRLAAIARVYTCSSNAVDTQSSVSEVESDTSSTSCSATPAPSLLDRLKAPQKSQLARKRAIKTNSGRFYKRHTIPSTKSDPKSVSPAERVSQHKDEPFTVSAGKLFCFGCQSSKLKALKKVLEEKQRALSPLLEINKKPHFRIIETSLMLQFNGH